MSYLSSQFLSTYEGVRPENAGPLFEVTYLSKYSRWLPEKNRREKWNEIIKRVVDYNIGLYSGPREDLREEAELMFDYLYHLRTYPAGRSLWISGTDASYKWGEANFNCCFTIIDELEDFCDTFHLLMVGAGVGFRILREDVKKLPRLRTNFTIEHTPYNYMNITGMNVENTTSEEDGNILHILVGDSKEGWVDSLRILFKELVNFESKFTKFIFNYNWVRPKKTRIKTFGGRAAGPAGLEIMFNKLETIIKKSSGSFKPLDCLDIICIIAESVLVGGIRRSALIALGSPEDQEFIDAKLYLVENNHRRKSNNSIVLSETPDKSKIKEVLNRVRQSWEPGFFNLSGALKRRPGVKGCNPCGEILLDDKGVCNLSGSYLPSHIKNGKLDLVSLEKSHRLATRIGMRQTNITISLPEWDKTQKRDRLLGVSLTGVMDALDLLGWDHDSEEALNLMKDLKFWACDEASRYAKEMRVPEPLLVTCIKPEGTVSLLTTVSCGMHRSYAPHFIRRYKMSNDDPMCQALKELGVPNEQDNQAEDRTVFEFYITSGAKMAANDEPAISQFTRYLNLMNQYVDHNVSCTLTLGKDEWSLMEEAIHENWDSIVAIALANKEFEENTNYTQLPYETLLEPRSNPDLSNLFNLINFYEEEEYEEKDIEANLTKIECAGGHCPIR